MRFCTLFVFSLASTALWASHGGDLQQQTRNATSILLGSVIESNSYYGTDGEIYSDVTVRVSAALKESGRKFSRLRTFTVKGGAVGDTRVVFTDVPTFEADEQVMLFLDADGPREKYAIHHNWVAELGEPADAVLNRIEQSLADTDEPVLETERRRAYSFIRELAAAPSAAADAGCYLLIGPKWAESAATYKFNANIPAAWQTSLAASAAAWGSAGTVFKYNANTASANELLVGAVSSANTLASTRIEYDSTMKMRKFTMTFSNAVAWSTTGEAGKYDVEGVTTHELGHALGLNHPSGSTCSEQTLWATAATGETKKRSLENGDKAGAAALYAAAPAPTPAPAPAPAPTPAPAPAPTPTPAPAPAPAPAPVVIPAPVFTTSYLFPALPRVGQSFTLWLLGGGFNINTVQVVITGPACPTGCVFNPTYKQPTMLSVVAAISVKGTYTIAIRNSGTGLLSTTKTLTVSQ